jgi:hypothetical protein
MLTGDDVFEEYEYDGYQSFGGKNFYVATFEMNVKSLGLSTVVNIYNRANVIFKRFVPSTIMDQLSYEDKRTIGIILESERARSMFKIIRVPKLVENLEQALAMNFDDIPDPTDCEWQGCGPPDDEGTDDWC